ncbi:MAG: UDP-N-acetylmuramate dehydrogenase [Betaproteobacteria bacterium]|nr:MAG: UDP-N-acetylmuramate dehydrogenase [Betaproteobacteria bacterium]
MHMRETAHFSGLRGELRLHEPMAQHVSWRAGGAAERCYVPADLEDLAAFLRQLPAGEPLLFVGLGSNLLVRDGGFRGTAVLMHSAKKHPRLAGGRVYAEAAVASPKVARFAALHGLAGAEFLAGIPGTIGGALAMNAGCYGGETWNIVERVLTIDRAGTWHTRVPQDYAIDYRHCSLRSGAEEWFAAAWFRLPPGDSGVSRERIRLLLKRRIAAQPLELPNAGSVFRNPPGDHAARLIEACGLKGLTRGGARVSEKHANFIVNPKGAARASDIVWLIEAVRAAVRAHAGIDLVAEVRIVGEA